MNPKVRKSAYYLSSALLYLLGLLQCWFSIKSGGDIADIITGIGTMIGGTAPHYAGYNVGQQINSGTFDQTSPADQVVNGVQAAVQASADAAKATADAEAELEKITQVVSQVGASSGLGLLAQQVIAASLK